MRSVSRTRRLNKGAAITLKRFAILLLAIGLLPGLIMTIWTMLAEFNARIADDPSVGDTAAQTIPSALTVTVLTMPLAAIGLILLLIHAFRR